MRKIFISYHHKREQKEKDKLAQLINNYAGFLNIKDMSVKMGDIEPSWPDLKIAKTIREQYLKDSTITILILGTHTKCRKHIDWEIESSLSKYGSLNRRIKINSLIILQTSEFIKENKKECISDNDDAINYHALITKANSGKRIYEIVKNDYPIISSFDEVFSDIRKLKNLLDKAEIKFNNENILYESFMQTNEIDNQQILEQSTIVKNKFRKKRLRNQVSSIFKKITIEDFIFLRKKDNSEDCSKKDSKNETQFYSKKFTWNDFIVHKNKYSQEYSEAKTWSDLSIESELQNQKIKKSKSIISL